jgi:hypothetical protein
VTKIISVTNMHLIKPKAGAKHELLFNEPASAFQLQNYECLWFYYMATTYFIRLALNKLMCFKNVLIVPFLTYNYGLQWKMGGKAKSSMIKVKNCKQVEA